jgi:hypothetical protein
MMVGDKRKYNTAVITLKCAGGWLQSKFKSPTRRGRVFCLARPRFTRPICDAIYGESRLGLADG